MVCEILCKCYASLIIAHDGWWSILHVCHIRTKLLKQNHFFRAMSSGRVRYLCCKQCNVCLHLPSNPCPKICSRKCPCLRGIIWSLKCPSNTLWCIDNHPMRWTSLWYELTHCTHGKCKINPRTHHCIHKRSYLGFVWNIFYLFIHILKSLFKIFNNFKFASNGLLTSLHSSIRNIAFYIHLVNLPIHTHYYYENASNGDEFGHKGKNLIKSTSTN